MDLSLILSLLTIIFSPLYIFRFHLLVPTTLLEVLILSTVVVTFFKFAKAGFPLEKTKTRFDLGIGLFLLATFLSLLITPNFLGGLGIFRAYFVEPILFFYCLILIFRKRKSSYIIWSLIAASFWLSILGLLQKITHGYSLAPSEITQGRVSAVFNSANSLALFLGPVTLLVFSFFIKFRGKLKLLFVLLFAFFSLIIFWTKSRGGIVAETLSLIVFACASLVNKYKAIKKFWPILLITLLLGITLFLYLTFSAYYQESTDFKNLYNKGDTLQIRYFIWAGTVNLLKDHLILGAGLDGFKDLYGKYYRLPQYQEEFQYPHNLILTFWTETGILGLFGFLLILVTAFGLLIRNLSQSKDLILGTGLIASLTFIVIHGVVDVPYFKNDLSLQFWILMALVEIWSRESR